MSSIIFPIVLIFIYQWFCIGGLYRLAGRGDWFTAVPITIFFLLLCLMDYEIIIRGGLR